MYYYDIHVEIPKTGYSVGLKSEVFLEENEVIKIALKQGLFEEKGDENFVDMIELISAKEFIEWFNQTA